MYPFKKYSFISDHYSALLEKLLNFLWLLEIKWSKKRKADGGQALSISVWGTKLFHVILVVCVATDVDKLHSNRTDRNGYFNFQDPIYKNAQELKAREFQTWNYTPFSAVAVGWCVHQPTWQIFCYLESLSYLSKNCLV